MQQVCIKWRKCCSNYFNICNDVRQGRVLSPMLFILYVNQLIDKLIACLDVCYEYGTDNDILFNPIKSVCTVFKPKACKLYLRLFLLVTMH